jgi:hypothetical protein
MDNRIVIKPSSKVNSETPIIFALVMNAILILVALFIVVVNFKKIMSLDIFQRIILLLVFAGMFGFHGLLHSVMGYVYGENLITIPNVMTVPI